MIADLQQRISGAWRLRRLRPWLAKVNALSDEAASRSDAELRRSTATLRERLAGGETLDDILPEAFALVREAAQRQVGLRHFDVQVLGALVMHRGWIAEMRTGEGKTLAATMPTFLHALPGRGVHVVTVNDYLAQRDAEWMGAIYKALGLTVDCIVHGMPDAARAAAYRADVTYGTNKEFAFDYLRDQLRAHAVNRRGAQGVFEKRRLTTQRSAARVQRDHFMAIVDEIDSILIDEARTPLIISDHEAGESPFAPAYDVARQVALGLVLNRDFLLDAPKRRVELTVQGVAAARKLAPSDPPPNRPFEHMVAQAVRAEYLFERDREYLLVDGKVAIVDEFTGRVLADRTWSLGLHQAIEAKEGVTITSENRTLASVTFQKYFKKYTHLTGMTGTARDAAREFGSLFDRPVVSVPTNRPVRRKRLQTRVYGSWASKYDAIADRIVELHRRGQPVLVGTRSVGAQRALERFVDRARYRACGAQRPAARAGGADHRQCRGAGPGHPLHQHGRPRRGHQAGAGRGRPGRPPRVGHGTARGAAH